tara:strand:+ start:864 stop:2276 length:1413 start_codon:yes stop_codon:yes gene_type:complete
MNEREFRIEKDSMGEMKVPADALYGASTMRAVKNFPVSNLRFQREFIRCIGLLKKEAARVNSSLNLLDPVISKAIIRAAEQVEQGKVDKHFVVDVFQTGSGTSTNMNANEVIANLANSFLISNKNSRVHPNDHVNFGQSSNDVIPTVIQLTALVLIKERLIPSMQLLQEELNKKSKEFWEIIKTGRTHLQDATPIRLGQEFLGYSGQIQNGIHRLNHAIEELAIVPLGGTAVGTGVNTHPEFAKLVCSELSKVLGSNICESGNHFHSQNTIDVLVQACGSIRTVAISLYKIANDIRWMGSGPRAGIGEILLPEVQPGSSIMPGKVNPVISESLLQVVAQVLGNDLTIMLSGQGGNFELNTMMPIAGYNLVESITILSAAINNFSEMCVKNLQATEQGPNKVEQGLAICTSLAPVIGYDQAAKIAKEASSTGESIKEVAKRRTSLSDVELDTILDPYKMSESGFEEGPSSG